jgi:hypothetical protein
MDDKNAGRSTSLFFKGLTPTPVKIPRYPATVPRIFNNRLQLLLRTGCRMADPRIHPARFPKRQT